MQIKHTPCRQESSWVTPRLAGEKSHDPGAMDNGSRGRVPAPTMSRRQENSRGTLCNYQSLSTLQHPSVKCSRCGGSHSDTQTREPTSRAAGCCEPQRRPPPTPSPGAAEALPLPEQRRWLPYNRCLLQALIFPANLHIQCLRSTLLWGFRVRTDTGAAGNGARWKPSSSSSSGEARGQATGGSSRLGRQLRGARLCRRYPPRPRYRAGLRDEAMPKAPPAQPGQDRQRWGLRPAAPPALQRCSARPATSQRLSITY